jgi:isocitrate dehydrogenase (NAD+)
MPKIVFVQGGGVGIDQEASLRKVLAAVRAPLELEPYAAGRAGLDQGLEAVPKAMLDAVRAGGLALKTKLLPPANATNVPVNYNVAFRRALGLYASVRPIHNVAGLPARFSNINFTLVREITEDIYAEGEHEVVPGVVQCFKVVTAAACLRFFKFVFEYARRMGKKSVHCIHKANILKMSDGLYLECFKRTAKDYADIQPKEMIIDNTCMQFVSKPQQFEVVAAGNMYGDLLSDLGAGLVGGISSTSCINHGDNVRVYEAVYGASHETVPPGQANPLPLLLPAVELLKDIGETTTADRIFRAIEGVLTEGKVKPLDLGGTAGTDEITSAIVAKL